MRQDSTEFKTKLTGVSIGNEMMEDRKDDTGIRLLLNKQEEDNLDLFLSDCECQAYPHPYRKYFDISYSHKTITCSLCMMQIYLVQF